MRTVIISPTEKWIIPDEDTIVPLYDLFLQHEKTGEPNGAIDSVLISGKTYKAPFYNGVAKFHLNENEKLKAVKMPKRLSVFLGGDEYEFYLWSGIADDARRLPAVFFSSIKNFPMSFIPNTNFSFINFAWKDDIITYYLYDRLLNFSIADYMYKEHLLVWFSKTIPDEISPTAKLVPVRKICNDDIKVSFILLSGEMRTYYLHEKKQVATFSEVYNFNDELSLTNNNKKTYQISDGKNKVSQILYLDNLTTEQANELNQLAVSRYVEIDGVRTNVFRKQIEINSEEKGLNSFFIEVEKPV